MCAVGKQQNIFLAGHMGSGKSTIGAKIANDLNFAFVDTDEVIMQEENLSVSEIFARFGEAHFRRAENALLEKLASGEKQVIATGGGMLANAQNLKTAQRHGIVFLLTADLRELAARLKTATDRPLLSGDSIESRLRQLDSSRAPVLNQIADRIDTTNLSPTEVATTIVMRFQEWLSE